MKSILMLLLVTFLYSCGDSSSGSITNTDTSDDDYVKESESDDDNSSLTTFLQNENNYSQKWYSKYKKYDDGGYESVTIEFFDNATCEVIWDYQECETCEVMNVKKTYDYTKQGNNFVVYKTTTDEDDEGYETVETEECAGTIKDGILIFEDGIEEGEPFYDYNSNKTFDNEDPEDQGQNEDADADDDGDDEEEGENGGDDDNGEGDETDNTDENNSGFKTYSFNAEIDDTQISNAEVSSCIDSDNNTHIAWIRTIDESQSVMYTVFNGITHEFTETTVYDDASLEIKIAPFIAVDEDNNVHITFIGKRDADGGSRSGNFAIMYAGQSGGSFDVSQVSTNADDPENDDEGFYNCYVNGRPKIILGEDVIVAYIADASNETGFDKYMIFATKNGSGWNYSQQINTDELSGNYYLTDGMSFLDQYTAAIIEISDYNPVLLRSNGISWSEYIIEGYSAIFGNSHVQLVKGSSQSEYLMWFHDERSTFCFTDISDVSNITISEYTTEDSYGGNFFPATVDQTTGDFIFFYENSSSDYVVILDEDGFGSEYEIDNIGTTYGNKNLYAQNGYISLVKANEGEQKIYVVIKE